MRKFHKLECYNRDRDDARRSLGKSLLTAHGIEHTIPSKGHFKVKSEKCHTLMFYPKTGCIIWKTHKKGHQHRFTNDDEGAILRKLKSLI